MEIEPVYVPEQDGSPQVFIFGQNSYGELGLGDQKERHIPTKLNFFDKMIV